EVPRYSLACHRSVPRARGTADKPSLATPSRFAGGDLRVRVREKRLERRIALFLAEVPELPANRRVAPLAEHATRGGATLPLRLARVEVEDALAGARVLDSAERYENPLA